MEPDGDDERRSGGESAGRAPRSAAAACTDRQNLDRQGPEDFVSSASTAAPAPIGPTTDLLSTGRLGPSRDSRELGR